MSAEAKNLEAITKAIIQHNGNCEFPVIEIQMCAYEVERLGWEEIRGIPIVPTDTLPEGRFRLVCDKPEPTADKPVGEALEDAEEGDFIKVGVGGPEERELDVTERGPTPELP